MSDQYPMPGQPGQQPPTQVAPQGGAAPGAPQYGAPGAYPQQGGYPQQGAPGGGYPGGGYPGGPGGPGGFPAPPTGGGGGKKGLIIGIIAGVVALVLAGVAVLVFVVLGDDDDDKKSARDDASTSETTQTPDEESSTPQEPTTVPTTEGSDATVAPTDSPTITSQAFLDSLLEGDCLAVEGLSTPDYFQREFGDQEGCKRSAGNLEMSNAEYTFDEPVITSATAIVTGDVYAPNTGKTLDSVWNLQASDDGSTWLVDGFSYTESG